MNLPHVSGRFAFVQLVCAGSASMSACYYAGLAPNAYAMAACAGFAFALDLVKPQFWTQCFRALRAKRYGMAAGAGILAALLAIASMIAVDGLIMRLRTDTSGGARNLQGNWDRADTAYKAAVAELAAIGKVEPVATLEAKQQTSVDATVWRRTAQCTDITQRNSADACRPAIELRAQMATSKRHAALEQARDAAKAVLDTTTRPAAADAQLETMRAALGWSEAQVLLALTWLVGLAIELVSCFGLAALGAHANESDAKAEPEPDAHLTAEQKALRYVLGEIGRSGGKLVVLNSALAARYEVSESTVTRWRQRWAAAGVIDERKDGHAIILKIARR